MADDKHFHQTPRRKAEFFNPPNTLKEKVGHGGLTEEVLKKAQGLLENNTYEYRPMGEMALDAMLKAITEARRPGDRKQEALINSLLFPTMQLKTNGGMFHYQLVTKIADRLVQFLEVIETLDESAIEVIEGFYTTMRAIFIAQLKGDGGIKGQQLYLALVDACMRYFDKFPQK